MPRDLFGEVTRPSITIGSRKWYTLPLSLLSHSGIIIMLIALPILAPAVMPSVFAGGAPDWIATILPPPPLPPARPQPDSPPPAGNPAAAPLHAPDRIAPENLDVRDFETQPAVGIINGSDDLDRVLIPPPPAPLSSAPPPPVRVGGAIRAPQKLREVSPVYPPIAQSARVQGIVIIEATIGADGQVTHARILRSVALLDQAAIDAVRQWQFTPTLLNGVPVPVIMTVTVNFTLR